MQHIALTLSYDGTHYHGWQFQTNVVSVQSVLQDALSRLTNAPVKTIGCGRTDAGVHARAYVASFFTNSTLAPERYPIALNSLLPRDISVSHAQQVSPFFHPIKSCLSKEYTYELYRSAVRDPFLENRALFWEYDLDVDAMLTASRHFLGTHDFAALRSSGTAIKNTVRTVSEYEIKETGSHVSFRVAANGFLYNMARAMVGTLLMVGQHKLSMDAIPEILASRDRRRAGPTAPAHGLYMTRVCYGKDELDA